MIHLPVGLLRCLGLVIIGSVTMDMCEALHAIAFLHCLNIV